MVEMKLMALSKIAHALNGEHIIWAVGGSLLLYFKGIVNDFNDIDIMVSEADVEKVKRILTSLGRQLPANSKAPFKSKYFLKFNIDGVDIDVIAGFAITFEGMDYYYPLQKDSIKDKIEVCGTKIPLQSVEEWHTYYKQMGRTDRVQIINASLAKSHLLEEN